MSEQRQKYLEKLNGTRWQQTRLKVFEREEWTPNTLRHRVNISSSSQQVLHERYEPWEYPLEALFTLCEETENRQEDEQTLVHALREKFPAMVGVLPIETNYGGDIWLNRKLVRMNWINKTLRKNHSRPILWIRW